MAHQNVHCPSDIWDDTNSAVSSSILTFASRLRSAVHKWQSVRVNQGELEPRRHVCT